MARAGEIGDLSPQERADEWQAGLWMGTAPEARKPAGPKKQKKGPEKSDVRLPGSLASTEAGALCLRSESILFCLFWDFKNSQFFEKKIGVLFGIV